MEKLHGFAFKMYMEGETKSEAYLDYKSEYGKVRGPNKLVNIAIALQIPYKYLLNLNNLLKSFTSK